MLQFLGEKGKKKGRREYLTDVKTRELTSQLDKCFEATVEVKRIRVGKK